MRILLAALAASVAILACNGGEDGDFDWVDWDVGSDSWNNPPIGGGGGGGGGGRTDAGVDTGGTTSDECPPRESAEVRYIAEDLGTCRDINLECRPGEVEFQSACGCGCVERDFWCPDALDGGVRYVGGDPSGCTAAFSCLPGWTRFNDGCGCGCLLTTASTCPIEKLEGIPAAVVATAWTCTSVTICFAEAIDETQEATVETTFPNLACDSSTIADCPAGTAASCGGPVGVVSSGAMGTLCGLARSEQVTQVDCGNP